MTIYSGFVLECDEHFSAGIQSYDDMQFVGEIRIHDNLSIIQGDDLNDAPFNCNGQIHSGKLITVEKGDYVVIIKKNP